MASLASAATGSLSTVGRRTAVVAASSGLLVSMLGAPAANAATSHSDGPSKLSTVDLDALTAAAKAELQTSKTVTVTKHVKWTADAAAVKVTPAPEPVVHRTVQAASRSEVRTALTSTTSSSASDTSSSSSSSSIPSSANGSKIIAIASRYVGVPYVYGGTTPAGMDCSGFTSYVYAQVGITLPRTSSAQHYAGTIISRAQAKPGDLIWTPGHVAIYAGGNTIIDAPRPGKTIQFRAMWQTNPTFIRVG